MMHFDCVNPRVYNQEKLFKVVFNATDILF